jgi:hypothetical protein
MPLPFSDMKSVRYLSTGLGTKDPHSLVAASPTLPAYVLGQMQHPASVEGLKARLQDGDENYMVRHECAEALGSIAHDDVRTWHASIAVACLTVVSAGGQCLPVLQAFAEDSERVVKESCVVALDMHAVWGFTLPCMCSQSRPMVGCSMSAQVPSNTQTV